MGLNVDSAFEHSAANATFAALYNPKLMTMSQVVLEFSNQNDLALLLSFAKRLEVKVISVKNDLKEKHADDRLARMKKASKDPLFLADIEAVKNDFAHADQDEI